MDKRSREEFLMAMEFEYGADIVALAMKMVLQYPKLAHAITDITELRDSEELLELDDEDSGF